MKNKILYLLNGHRMAIIFIAGLVIFSGCVASSPKKDASLKTGSSDTPLPDAKGSSAAMIEEGVPGGIIVNTIEMTAKVAAIDSDKRKVTLIGPDEKKHTIKVSPEAANFDQVQVGDLVDIIFTEELIVYLDKYKLSAPDGYAGVVALAPKGSQPGGLAAETIQVTATITNIDYTNRKATLQFPDSSEKTIPVRDDIDLSQYSAGDKVVFQVTEMTAISVEKH